MKWFFLGLALFFFFGLIVKIGDTLYNFYLLYVSRKEKKGSSAKMDK
jgi:hypothetical protein